MPIGFKIYPTTNRVPGVFAEVNPNGANTAQQNMRALIIGQTLSGATYPANVATIMTSYKDAVAGSGGAGAMLAQMAQQYRAKDTFGEVWLLPVADNGAGSAATGKLSFTGPATQAGTLKIYIGGGPLMPPLEVAVSSADAATVIATNVVAAMALRPDLPVTGVVNGSNLFEVDLTANHKGLSGNDIDIRMNYYGAVSGEVTPAGVGVTITAMSGGATNPVLTTALANLAGDQTFDFIVCPYNDATSLNAIEAFLNDTSGRWSWEQELFGGCFYAFRGTLGDQVTFGTGRNDQHAFCMGLYDSPTLIWQWAADFAASCAVSIRANPAVPLQDLQLNVFAPPIQSRFDIGERNTMLYDGMSTFKVNDAGQVFIDRAITTYQTTSGVPDDSYLDVETMFMLQFLIRDMRSFLATMFSRMILVSDGTPIAAGSNMCTSQTVLKSAVSRYRQYAKQGLAQNPDQFAQQATGENAGNGLVELNLPWMLANQLRQIAALISFSKP